jgi:hypothetical protein
LDALSSGRGQQTLAVPPLLAALVEKCYNVVVIVVVDDRTSSPLFHRQLQ